MSTLHHVVEFWPYIVRMCENRARAYPHLADDKPRDLSNNEGVRIANATVAAEESTAEQQQPDQPVAETEPWRSLKLADLDGLTPKIVEILDGHDIRTLGDWVDVPAKRGVEYTQLKGITEARFEKIQAAMMKATTAAE